MKVVKCDLPSSESDRFVAQALHRTETGVYAGLLM